MSEPTTADRKAVADFTLASGEFVDEDLLAEHFAAYGFASLERERVLREALECIVLVVGLTAFKYEEQRKVLQEAVDKAQAALAKTGGG